VSDNTYLEYKSIIQNVLLRLNSPSHPEVNRRTTRPFLPTFSSNLPEPPKVHSTSAHHGLPNHLSTLRNIANPISVTNDIHPSILPSYRANPLSTTTISSNNLDERTEPVGITVSQRSMYVNLIVTYLTREYPLTS
jgi:hypothetical protein